MSFHFEPLAIPDVIRVTPDRYGDQRGFFSETYRASAFAEAGIRDVFLQDNHARSTLGVLRGLHYQAPPRAQAKLVRVVFGEVFDVAVDCRRGSPTFGRWAGGVEGRAREELVAERLGRSGQRGMHENAKRRDEEENPRPLSGA